MTTKINLDGINEIDITSTVNSSSVAAGVVTLDLGGGATTPVGVNLWPIPRQSSLAAGSWAGFTMGLQIPGKMLQVLPSTWKFSINIGGANMTVDNIKIAVTALDSTSGSTVLSRTTVTFGGSATPTLTVGVNTSDAISLALNNAHDYWILLHFNAGASGSGTVGLATVFPYGANAQLGGWISGDHTGDATTPTFSGSGIYFYQILTVS